MSKLQNFDYQNVALKEGHWKKQRDELIETYLKIEDDDMLHPFRKLANLPNKGHGLVGWYGSGASTFGQKLGAFAKLYLVTGDIRLKEKAIRLADGWGECLAASGDLPALRSSDNPHGTRKHTGKRTYMLPHKEQNSAWKKHPFCQWKRQEPHHSACRSESEQHPHHR